MVLYLRSSVGLCRYEVRLAEAEAQLALPYTALAELINCHKDEVAILDSATHAWNQVSFLAIRGCSD